MVEADKDEVPGASHAPLPRVRGSHLAYAISTSGTTGRPKLIGVEHRQVANLLAFATQKLLQPEDVRCVPFIDSPSFDSSISQIFTTLALGGTLVRLPDLGAVRTSPHFEKFTCLGTTPSLLAVILKTTGLPPAVRLVGLGAEAIPPDLLEKLDALPQLQKVINYYGPTETTVYCTYSIVLDRADASHGSSTCAIAGASSADRLRTLALTCSMILATSRRPARRANSVSPAMRLRGVI